MISAKVLFLTILNIIIPVLWVIMNIIGRESRAYYIILIIMLSLFSVAFPLSVLYIMGFPKDR